MTLPALLPRDDVQDRLRLLFPDGKNYLTRDIAGATVFTLLYIGAIEGTGRFLGPKHVYKMSDDQAALTSDADRLAYGAECAKAGYTARGTQWYADNTREPIRDETLRQGLIPVGAVTERSDLPTTSPRPRYGLTSEFAALFDPKLTGKKLTKAIKAWQGDHLSAAGLARISVVQAGRTRTHTSVYLTLPSGETRQMKPGPSNLLVDADGRPNAAGAVFGTAPYLKVPACEHGENGQSWTGDRIRSPYGRAGDRLWVRESCRELDDGSFVYKADFPDDQAKANGPWKNVRFVPKISARIWLELVEVRVERLQAITEEDAESEGVEESEQWPGFYEPGMQRDSRNAFAVAWDQINGKRQGARWADDPWVWRLGFRRLSDQLATAGSGGAGRTDSAASASIELVQ